MKKVEMGTAGTFAVQQSQSVLVAISVKINCFNFEHVVLCGEARTIRHRVSMFKLKTYDTENIKWFYVANTVLDSWVLTAVFLNFVLLTVTKSQVGIYIAIASAIAILVEVPSGTLADNLGRRTISLLGFILMMLFLVAWLFATILGNGLLILLGFILAEISIALLSGSLEALAYDSLKATQKEDAFDELQSQAKSIQIIGLMAATFVGGLLWQINNYLPLLANMVVVALGIFATYKMEEIDSQDCDVSTQDSAATLLSGFTHIHHAKMKLTIAVMAAPATLFILWGGGFVQLEVGERAGLSETSLATLLTFILMANYVTSRLYERIRRKLGDGLGFLVINSGMAIGCIVLSAVSESIAVGVVGIILIRLFGKFTQAWPSSVLNETSESNVRATTISTFAFITRVPYLFVLPIYMSLSDAGKSITFLCISLLLIIAGICSLRAFNQGGSKIAS